MISHGLNHDFFLDFRETTYSRRRILGAENRSNVNVHHGNIEKK